jgi:hypothetical protein
VSALAEDERLKLGVGIVSTTVAVFLAFPEVPVIVRGYTPGTAVALACAVSDTEVAALAVGQFSFAVTPAGTPEIVRFTFPLLSPTSLRTLITLLALPPPTRRVSALGEAARLKLGVGMVSFISVVLVNVPDVPTTAML